jgi:uncharacterized protein (TIGR02594 family)
MSNIQRVQLFLIAQGFNLGKGGPSGNGDDGIAGRLTQQAVKDWQTKHGMQATGLITPDLLQAMLGPDMGAVINDDPPWLELMLRKKGLHEQRDYDELRKFLKTDGKTLGDPRKLPWCGDLVETCIAVTLPNERLPGNPYWALNWADFGRDCDLTCIGAVLSFKRPGGGHVGFNLGVKGKYIKVGGGNQSNSISVVNIDKSRLVGCRWPLTYPLPTRPSSGADVAAEGVSHNEA